MDNEGTTIFVTKATAMRCARTDFVGIVFKIGARRITTLIDENLEGLLEMLKFSEPERTSQT